MIELCVATDVNFGIGRAGKLPWASLVDMAHFRQVTQGKCLVFGRTTWDGIQGGLPGRTVYVLSRSPDRYTLAQRKGAYCWWPPEEPIAGVLSFLEAKYGDVVICGGKQIYNLCWPFVQKVYLTVIGLTTQADTYWQPPCVRPTGRWALVSEREVIRADIQHTFQEFVRS